MRRTFLAISLLGLIVGCPAGNTTRNDVRTGNSALAGRWKGTNAGLTVALTIQQAADSLTGTGTYQAARDANIGCGGETLPASGSVTFGGELISGGFQGRMRFDDTWSPPYLGTLNGPDSLNGHFMSVDRGGCALTLVRQR
jgi:hypothetical protein